MIALWIALPVAAWITCGVFGYGYALYDLDSRGAAAFISVLGPVGLFVALLCVEEKTSLRYRNQKENTHGSREAPEDHRSGTASDTGTGADPAASTATRARTSVGAAPSIPRETSTEPIGAWKVANLWIDHTGRGVTLASLNEGSVHPIEGTARCTAYRSMFHDGPYHYDAPHLECSCGFYAWRTRAQAVEMINGGGCALLQVELFGTVIEHENGYRAKGQRVLGVYLDQRCNGFMCHSPARWVDFPARSDPRAHPAPFKVWCDEHKPAQDAAPNLTTAQEIANYLQCEVTWASA